MTRKADASSKLAGVFKVLAMQHAEARALLERAHDPAQRAELWPTIRSALISHEQAEIREVYPVLREYAETRALADHHDVEASELSSTIAKLDASPPDAPAWTTLFVLLVELVTRHVDEEENMIFPKALAAIGVDRARAIEPTFLAAHQHVMESA
jgi:hemerythrin superfamily protein